MAVRDLRGLTLDRAKDALAQQGLRVGAVQSREVAGADADTVIEHKPAPGLRVRSGTRVDIVIAAPRTAPTPPASPPAEVAVRALKGLSLERARDALAKQGLEVGEVQYRETDAAPAETVIDQKPAGGETTARGRAVDLLIARTPPPAAASPLPGVSSTWRYRYTSGWPTIPRRVLVHRVLDVSGGRVRESITPESGGAADVKTFDGSARIVTRLVDGLTLEEFSPFLQAFGQIDRGWRKGNIPAPPEAAFASGWTISASAAAEETVTVPAGSFKAIRVELSGALLGAPRTAAQQVTEFNQRIWYAPQVKRVVKYERNSFDQSGTPMDRDRYELLDYQLR